jgi:hypothetical protein
MKGQQLYPLATLGLALFISGEIMASECGDGPRLGGAPLRVAVSTELPAPGLGAAIAFNHCQDATACADTRPARRPVGIAAALRWSVETDDGSRAGRAASPAVVFRF